MRYCGFLERGRGRSPERKVCQTSILSASVISRITRAGVPAAKVCGGISLMTTLPAPMTAPSPIVTPPQTVTDDASQTSLPIVMGLAYSIS